MRAAAPNLTPLTLELGGKSPVIVSRSADMKTAAARIMNGKTLNAGQICLAPDYVLVPQDKMQSFVDEARGAVGGDVPDDQGKPGLHRDHLPAAFRPHHRLRGGGEGGRRHRRSSLKPDGENLTQQEHRKIAPTLILDPSDDLKVMKEEIFGPVLPVKGYATMGEAVAYVNAHDRPLGLYYFGEDAAEREGRARTRRPPAASRSTTW